MYTFTLFNLCSEDIISRALLEQDTKVKGKPINNIYADDTVVIAETPEDLQILINGMVECRLSLNIT